MLQPLAKPCLDLMLFVSLCDCTDWHKVHLELISSSICAWAASAAITISVFLSSYFGFAACLTVVHACYVRYAPCSCWLVIMFCCCCLCVTFDTVIAGRFAVHLKFSTFDRELSWRTSDNKIRFHFCLALSSVCCRFDQKMLILHLYRTRRRGTDFRSCAVFYCWK